MNFMIVGHTHDDIDALFALKKESFSTIPFLMKSFMDIETVPTIFHLIEEVPNFKKFIENGIVDGENTLLRHTKAQQFKFYVNAMGCPIIKYKLLCTDDDWLLQDGGIKLWKEDCPITLLSTCHIPDRGPVDCYNFPSCLHRLLGNTKSCMSFNRSYKFNGNRTRIV